MKKPHHRNALPRVLGCLNPYDPMPTARRVMDRFSNIWATHGGRAWLFVDGLCRVRVFHDSQASLQRWLRWNTPELVGCYTKEGAMIVENIANDLQTHYIQMLVQGLIVSEMELTSAI